MALSRVVARPRRCRPTLFVLVAVACATLTWAHRAASKDANATTFVRPDGARVRAPPAPPSALASWFARGRAEDDDDETRAVTIGEAEMRATCGACEGMGAFVRAAAGRRRAARGLELACGTGTFLREMRERGFKIVGVDPRIARTRDRGGDLAAKGVATAASLRRLPYRRAFFDYVVAFEPFGKMEMKATKENVDPVINEATRVAKKGAMMVFALAKTLDGGSPVGDEDETYQTRRWWMDTFCAHGWVEDREGYRKLITSEDSSSSKRRVRRWFVLKRVKKVKKHGSCACFVPPGKDAESFCGGRGRPNARKEVKAFWKSLGRRRHQKPRG